MGATIARVLKGVARSSAAAEFFGEVGLGIQALRGPCRSATHRRWLANVQGMASKSNVDLLVRAGLVLLVVGVLVESRPARACSVCGCGDPLLTVSDPAAITGSFRVQVDTEYLRIDAGTDGRPGHTDQLSQWSYRFNAVYRPLDALSLAATVSLVSKTIHTVGLGTDVVGSDLTGLGDIELAARYAVWHSVNLGARRVQEFAVSAGAAIPTGSHNARASDGTLIDPHGQLGTGGWGPFVGVHYRLEQGDWLAYASVSYRVRTEASFFDGSKYTFGNALLWSVHGQYLPHRRVALDLGVDGRYANADKATAADGTLADPVDNTGGTVLAAAPGVYFNAAGGLWFFVRGQLPFYKDLFGEQDVKPSVVTGVQFQVF